VQNAPVRLPLTLSPLAVLFSLSLAALGCNEAKLIPAAGDAGCGTSTIGAGCKPQPVGNPGCNGDLDSGVSLGYNAVFDASFPASCTVFVNKPTPDSDNNCIQLGSCICNEDAGTFAWTCYR